MKGIHMPCKSVVFAGDSVFLNSLNYHQVGNGVTTEIEYQVDHEDLMGIK